jgi:hypothetical protein
MGNVWADFCAGATARAVDRDIVLVRRVCARELIEKEQITSIRSVRFMGLPPKEKD